MNLKKITETALTAPTIDDALNYLGAHYLFGTMTVEENKKIKKKIYKEWKR